MRVKAILFDLDGTLLNTLEDLMDAVNYVMRTFGWKEHSLEAIRAYVGNGIRNLMILSTPDGEDNPRFEEAFSCFEAYYLTHNQIKTKPYDGILELLATLKDMGMPMAIVTNKNQPTVDILCRDVFQGLVTVAVGDDGVRARKPDKAPVYEAIRRLGMDPEDAATRAEILYIGDSDVDAKTAAAADTKLCLCTWGFRERSLLEQFSYDAMIDEPSELLPLIEFSQKR